MSEKLKLKTKSKQKPQLNVHEIFKMNSIKLDAKKFQRIARKFYNTTASDRKIWLHNKKNKNSLEIDLLYDEINGYIRFLFAIWDANKQAFKYVNVQVKKPKYCKDLFIYMLKYNFLDNGKIN